MISSVTTTQLSDTRKSLMANRDHELQSSHNPLVLGSNPSGPSLSPKTEMQRIRPSRGKGTEVNTGF